MSEPAASGRLVRSFVRYLRERIGEGGIDAIARELSAPERALLSPQVGKLDWVPFATWLPVLAAFERRFGDLQTWRLLREMTRATMAVAVAKGWSAFLADTTPDLLMSRSGTLWQMSYNTGQLVVLQRGARHCRMAIEGWPDPPEPVVASVAEACVVFLVRLGERTGRAVEETVGGRAEIEVNW
jgi:hypothetical protein